MRYRDASHVDLGSFYARMPEYGGYCRWLGYLALAGAINFANVPNQINALLIACLAAWLVAWSRSVGALWRGPLVAAILACALIRTYHLLGSVQLHASCADGQCLMSKVLSVSIFGGGN